MDNALLTKPEIDITSEFENFKNHLDLPANNQIVFSGLFGIGKTYFLKQFFDNHTDDYEVLWVKPVNYSIAQTDDILKYIKYDIAFQLLSNGNVEYEKTDFSIVQTSEFFLKENPKELAFDILKIVEKLGFPSGRLSLYEFFKSIDGVYTKLKQHNRCLQNDEKNEVVDFLWEVTKNDKSIYEENVITLLISGLVQTLKRENDGRQKNVILIIDDLDRLDPEHVFRILNVFSCHFDFGDVSGNKFNVDKIITVCDIDNIRNIYHAKYGQNVDFSGYIDKFYSREIYHFDNKKMIKNAVSEIINSIVFDTDTKNVLRDSNCSIDLLNEILGEFVNNNLINLRVLLKYFNVEIRLKDFFFKNTLSTSSIRSTSQPIIVIFQILIRIYGSEKSLKKAFENWESKSSEIFFKLEDARKYCNIISFLNYGSKFSSTGIALYKLESHNLQITYCYDNGLTIAGISSIDTNETQNHFPLAYLINKAFDKFLKLDIIN